MASQSGGYENVRGGGGGEGDGRRRLKPKFSYMEQPPLLKQLKCILAEYPDGGQIVKELIQNAEDAGATTVKIVYDARPVNQEATGYYSKFFKGPALLLYNDGMFTEQDWKGIKMIYSSVKEDDRLKVGRFGLGFKSVFHITDFPSVISGNTLLLINPHEHASEVNAEFEVDHLSEYEGIDVSEFHNAFGESFQDVTTTGQLQGTIFRFPLRQLETPLSDNVYNERKVLDLFDAFKKEASYILLFLKGISNITLSVKKSNKECESIAAVELVNNLKEIQAERNRFKSEISKVGSDYNGNPIENFSEVHIQTTLYDENEVSCQSTQTWLVVSYFMGNNASKEFKKLIQDKSIGYSPYVGIAAPLGLTGKERCEGHEFCFLPLPKEGRQVTGLPFHVNGFFSLSQNRHHIKWATDEQQENRITDKNILWNQSLAGEALPLAYKVLLDNAIQIAKSRNLGSETIASILPLYKHTSPNWMTFVKNLFHQIKDITFLKVHEQSTWVNVDEACFATFSSIEATGGAEMDEEMKNHVVKSLLLMNQPYVKVSSNLFKTLCHFYGGIIDTVPQTVSSLLKKAGPTAYTPLPNGLKSSLIQFLLSANNYELLVDLKLIPLASKQWAIFKLADSHEEKLLLPSEAHRELNFPGLEDRFLEVPDNMLHHFDRICTTGKYNVKLQTNEDTVEMISRMLSKNGATLKDDSLLSLSWLEKVWSFVRFHVNKICKLPLVPLLRNGSWENPLSVDLIPLNKMVVLKSTDEHEDLSDGLCNCLEHLSITVLTSLPPWFPLDETSRYICQPSQLDRLLKKMANTSNINSVADIFNKKCPNNKRQELRKFIASFHTDDEKLITLQKKLELFYESDNLSQPKLVSLVSKSHRMEYVLNLEYPIRYPKQYLLIDNDIETLVKRLGASCCYRGNLVELTVQRAMLDHSEQDKITFMKFFIENFEEFSNIPNITQMVKKIKFVKCKGLTDLKSPPELFDPTDSLLQNLLDDCFFPEDSQPAYLNILKRLGLNKFSGLKAEHVRNVAVYLDKSSVSQPECGAKADAVLLALCRRPQLLKEKCATGSKLKAELSKLCWLNFVKNSPPSFPNCISWFSTNNSALCRPNEAKLFEKWHTIIGAVMPTVECDNREVINHFGWNIDPQVTMVVEQLELVKKRYNVEFKTEIVMIVKAAYDFLDKHRHESMMAINFKELVWCGHMFVSPCKAVVHKTTDSIDLKPYRFLISEEMARFAELFNVFGCHQTQDADLLISVLNDVEKKYQCENDLNTKEDLQLVVRVLEKLGKIEDIASRASEVLVPVQTSEQGQLVLKPASECAYTDEEYMRDEEDEGEFTFVHECITERLAKVFGIKSIAGHVLADAEGLDVEEWGQEEPLTTRLNSLLREGYKDGLSVPKELVQNADDANASVVKILYDERQNSDNMTRLLNKGMQACQGPALWFYNDASFTETDFQNIIKLNGATKKNDGGKIGKFGLGFCSVYNLTDVPSFFSGTTFVFFDPHRTYLRDALPGVSSGMKINLNTDKRDTQIRKYRDQFSPFQDVFGCSVLNERNPFKGTLFRFPLRTEDQASNSKIKKKTYSKEEVSKLLSMFIETAGDMLLFTQNVQRIEIYHLGPTGKPRDSKLLFAMKKEIKGVNLPNNTCLCSTGRSVLQTMSSVVTSNISDVHVISIQIDVYDTAESILQGSKETHTECSWVVSWSTGEQEAKRLANRIVDRRALSLAAVAVPCLGSHKLQPYPLEKTPSGFHRSGRLFCFLPLPIESGLSIQLNACFDVTSDRRQLLSDSEDDMETISHRWNKALLTDAAVCAFLQMLEAIFTSSSISEYYSIWPISKPKHTKAFVSALYTYIVTQNIKVFKGIGNTKLSFSQVTFIDPVLRENKYIGRFCIALLSKFQPQVGKLIIDLPINILMELKDCNQISSGEANVVDKAIIKEQELILTFLNSLQDPFWLNDIKMRNAFLSFSLKSESQTILEILRTMECIPTKPHGRLRKPGEMVSERSRVVHLFIEEDERFIQVDEMFDFDIETKLKRLGIITDKLPKELLLDRCNFIERKAKLCCVCGYEFCLKMMQYFCRLDIQMDIQSKNSALQEIQNSYILPVLCRPRQWTLPWFSEQSKADVLNFSTVCEEHKNKTNIEPLCLGKPKMMHRQSLINKVCCIGLLVNEVQQFSDALKPLGVMGSVPFETVVSQFEIIISNYTKEECFRRVLSELYVYLSGRLERANTSEKTEMKALLLKNLSNSPVVMIDSHLVEATDVAFHVKSECRPYLYRLPAIYESQWHIFEAFGVKPSFSCADAIEALKQERKKWIDTPCNDVETICSLLKVLVESMERQKCKYHDLKENHSFIVAPDANRMLRPTSELVTNEDDFITKQNVYVLNGEIPPAMALQIGVQSKQKKCREIISRGIPFGQKETLETRLQGLLKAYPFDSGIMKELIQNADDAGATEICFITDFRQHDKDEKYGCDLINEPSLCVFNNSSFTEQDMEGIHNLGRGSKGSDPTKTGQYGVGFNAVYHLTDLPSFMTVGPDLPEGGSVCIFDPLCTHIVDVSKDEPGIRSEVNGLRSDFPNMLLGFHERTLLSNGIGTVFRFPLRQKESSLSSNILTPDKLNAILEQLKQDMLDVLLFVKNVSCIKIMDISSGQLQENYVVNLQMAESDRENFNIFNKSIKEYISQHQEKAIMTISIPFREVQYTVTVKDSDGTLKKWLLVQRCGFQEPSLENDAFSDLKCAFQSGDIGLLPVGGVAIPLNDFEQLSDGHDHDDHDKAEDKLHTVNHFPLTTFTGRAFCFLPLPIQTELPVHINGHFALDHEARRELWREGFRETWNNCLLNYVVIPAWLAGIERLQTMYVNSYVEQCASWSKVNRVIALYHFPFPTKQTSQIYWTRCVTFFYQTLIERRSKLFPVVKNENPNFNITWFPVQSPEPHASGVFNVIKRVLPDQGSPSESYGVKRQLGFILSDIFKKLGMRFLHTPLTIYDRMTSLKLKTDVSDTSYVINFLQTFNKEDSICKVGSLNQPIEQTNFGNVECLLHVVRYIRLDKNFSSKINGLPIMLTADNVLHQCSVDEPVLSSHFLDLLPQSKCMFLHRSLVDIFSSCLGKKSVVVDLTIEKFAALLPDSFDKTLFCSGNNIPLHWSNESLVSISWSCMLFQFLFSKGKNDLNDFTKSLKLIRKWSFLPSVHHRAGQSCRLLIPIERVYSLFQHNVATYTEPTLNELLAPLGLPAIDDKFSKHMIKLQHGAEIIFYLRQLCASTEKPDVMLRCLEINKTILPEKIQPDLANTLAVYFNSNLSVLKTKYAKYGQNLKQYLKHLPMYITSQGTVVAIQDRQKVCVIPEHIPSEGVVDLAEKEKLVLLKKHHYYKELYEYLGLSFQNLESFYAETLLPSMVTSMPATHWSKHIEYIKSHCLLNNGSFTPLQQKILQQLRNIPFVNSKKANEYVYHEHSVFKCMLPENRFLPTEYRSAEWIEFLKNVGLVMEVDDDMFVRFAREIEARSTNFDNDVQRKSMALMLELLNRNPSHQLLSRISGIRFVIPFKVQASVKHYCSQYQNGNQLICFRDSTNEENWKLCWTGLSMIPESIHAKLNKEQRTQLGILDDVPLQHVATHCRQVCVTLKTLLEKDRGNKELADFVKLQMDVFYDFFYRNLKKDNVQAELRHIPLVYIPQLRELIQPDQTVVELLEKDQIRPYIYRVPRDYNRYAELFIALGGEEYLTTGKLASILEKVYLNYKEAEVIGSDREVVIKTLDLLFAILKSGPLDTAIIKQLEGISKLYLPNMAMVMCDSTSVVVNNAPCLSRRLGNMCLNWFMGLEKLKILCPDESACMKLFPRRIQPLYLNDILKDTICLDNVGIVEQSHLSNQLNEFLQSPELLEGLIRLIKLRTPVEQTIIEDVKRNLTQIQCIQVRELPTVLQLNGITVEGSAVNKRCHIQKESLITKFYFQIEDPSQSQCLLDLNKANDGFCDLILNVLKQPVPERYAMFVVDCIYNPHEIRSLLDSHRIDRYNLYQSDSVLDCPVPGTYVEEKILPFLVQDLRPFQKLEFRHVAMEFTTLSNDVEVKTFKYVHILEAITGQEPDNDFNMCQEYRVNCGEVTPVTVGISYLYRFVRPSNDGKDTFGNEPQNEEEFEQCCHIVRKKILKAWELPQLERDRIFERLMEHWCDGNFKGNEFALRVFNYICEIIIKLEKSEQVIDMVNADTGRIAPDTQYSYIHTVTCSVRNRSRNRVRSYNSSSMFYQTYNHSSAAEAVRPDIGEARRWLRQATHDYQAACITSEYMEDVPVHNWTCYKCHQACEKALKAVRYSINANKIPKNDESHNLTIVAEKLTSDLQEQARLIMGRLGDQSQLLYPDSIHRERIPSDMYDMEAATFAIEHTKRILELAGEAIDST